jgi:UMF1 family MFS transporter
VERVTVTFANFIANRYEEIDGFKKAISFSTILFWAMAVLVGTVQGGIQAVSRSYFGKLIPKKRSNEFFGFFDIFGKFASVLGPFLYALISGWTGRSSFGVLALILLFLIGLVIMVAGKKHFEALDTRPEE